MAQSCATGECDRGNVLIGVCDDQAKNPKRKQFKPACCHRIHRPGEEWGLTHVRSSPRPCTCSRDWRVNAPQRPGIEAVRGLGNTDAATLGQYERRGSVPADPALLSDPHNTHPRVCPDRHFPHMARAGRGGKAGINTPTKYAAHTTGKHRGGLCPL